MVNNNVLIVKELFKKETNLSIFYGNKVIIQHDTYSYSGEIFTSFGNSGKVKVRFNDALEPIKDELKGLTVVMKIQKIVSI